MNNERFEEKSHQTYNNLEQLLLKGDQLSESNEVEAVTLCPDNFERHTSRV